jgi:hypothetical protein
MKVSIRTLKKVILDAIQAGLEQVAPKLRALEHIDSEIDGISLDLVPWSDVEPFALSFRNSEITRRINLAGADAELDARYNSAEWKYFQIVSSLQNKSAPIKKAAKVIHGFYEDAENNRMKLTEAAHLIFLAGADALLDKTVTKRLEALGFEDLPAKGREFLDGHSFEYVVIDPDGTVAANYCEIVIANRVTERILSNGA